MLITGGPGGGSHCPGAGSGGRGGGSGGLGNMAHAKY